MQQEATNARKKRKYNKGTTLECSVEKPLPFVNRPTPAVIVKHMLCVNFTWAQLFKANDIVS